MKVMVIHKETGTLAGIYGIVEGGLNYTPSMEGDYFKTAWKTAARDGDVDADERDEYTFRIEQET